MNDTYCDLVNYIASHSPVELDWVKDVDDFLKLTPKEQSEWVRVMLLHAEAFKICCLVADDGKVLPQHITHLEAIKKKLADPTSS